MLAQVEPLQEGMQSSRRRVFHTCSNDRARVTTLVTIPPATPADAMATVEAMKIPRGKISVARRFKSNRPAVENPHSDRALRLADALLKTLEVRSHNR
jgi:hypothetical protein